MTRRVIGSFYADNVDERIVSLQKQMIYKFKPDKAEFYQLKWGSEHHKNINSFVSAVALASYKKEEYSVFLILDIDAIPLQAGVIEYIFHRAEAGSVIGIAQRSNHIDNGAHIFCGAPCVAMSINTWRKIGRPKADPTPRGDVCEEWTWKAQEHGVPVEFIYPTRFKEPPIRMSWETNTEPFWRLEDDNPEHRYGRGTFYAVPGFDGEGLYHQYQSFFPGSAEMFIETASEVLVRGK